VIPIHKEAVSEYGRQVDTFRRDLLRRTLERANGNRTHAARLLGLQRTYFLRLIREFNLNPAGIDHEPLRPNVL
jgi:DNA-binding NtrC family response regulator